jgi:hypothetical protein
LNVKAILAQNFGFVWAFLGGIRGICGVEVAGVYWVQPGQQFNIPGKWPGKRFFALEQLF